MNKAPSAYGFEIVPGGQGVIFTLSGNAKRDRCQAFGAWEARLRRDIPRICVRGSAPDLREPLDEVIKAAHEIAQELLDIVAVEERTSLLITEPHNTVTWRTGPHGLKVQLTEAITFAAEPGEFKATVTNAQGEIIPDPPYLPPQHHAAYRYFRYSQAAQNVFDAYRNMFLSLESMLDHIAPKQANENETEWMKRTLTDAVRFKGLNLGSFATPVGKDPVENFLDAHYSAVRCAVFHSKSSAGHALRPGNLADQDTVLQQLLAVQALVEHLLKTEFSVRLPGGGFFHSGFGRLLSQIAQGTMLLVSTGECPTVEQLLANEENLPEGVAMPVTFAGLNGAVTDEWLFVSEVKPQELPFARISSLRLATNPTLPHLYGLIAHKMNRTLMSTELDLAGVSKLVVRIRCVLRNLQQPKRGFSC
jgi:hypothetical protein